jgi:FkbH-like protein
LQRISKKLNIGLEHFVFVDDHPAERHAVRAALPQVIVPEMPEDPSEYVRMLERGLWFEAIEITGEDNKRAAMYRDENNRTESRLRFASTEDYIASLGLIGTVRPIDEQSFARVVQLIGKTNQFNLTTRRHSESQIRGILEQPRSVCLTVFVRDRYGDYGLVAVVLAIPAADDSTILEIDSWLMSCRVIGRTVEQFTFQCLLRQAVSLNYQRMRGIFAPTKRNQLVHNLYPDLGFSHSKDLDDGSIIFESPIPPALKIHTSVAEAD